VSIDTAIVLAAGAGSRLQAAAPHKPLCTVGGISLLGHALRGLHKAGLSKAVVVTGHGAEAVEAAITAVDWPLEVEWVRNPEWQLPNGVSVRAAAPLVRGQDVLMLMSDHLVDPRLYARVRQAGAGAGLRLGVDRHLDSELVDEEDVTCVETSGTRIAAIGKGLVRFDAYDVGVFALSPAFFDALDRLESPSITEGVRALIPDGQAEVVDCTGLDWADVDDAEALAKAERLYAQASWRSQ